MIQHIANWACIIGFCITIFTLLTTLNIRGKVDRSLGKQRFLQQREKIVADVTALRRKIAYAGGDGAQDMDAILLELRTLAMQLTHFHIWRWQDRRKLKQFIRYMSEAYMPDKPGAKSSAKALIMRIDELVALVKAQAEV